MLDLDALLFKAEADRDEARAETARLRYALSMCSYNASRIKERHQGGFIGDMDDCDQIINRVTAALPKRLKAK